MQIIASAGAGKTEVVSQRVVSLLGEGIDGRQIVAFTFNKKAAEELKQRIALRTEQLLGADAVRHLTGLFVGTIHAYCFRLLQQLSPRYETYDVLDDAQLTALLSRESTRLGIKDLSQSRGKFDAIRNFRSNAAIVENELIDPTLLTDPFKTVYLKTIEMLDRYRLLSYGLQVARAVKELENPLARSRIANGIGHLIVDEYQDVNPAQERLIGFMLGDSTQLCVVGDDDQAIYQWRGSNVRNILTFTDRYPGTTTFSIKENRRSRPQIVDVANRFAATIPERLPKAMAPTNPHLGDVPEVTAWTSPTEDEEVGYIVQHVLELSDRGIPFSQIAILVRSSIAYDPIIDRLSVVGVPVQVGGRTGLFTQPIARALGHLYFWLVDEEWRENRQGQRRTYTLDDVLEELVDVFGLEGKQRGELRRALNDFKASVPKDDRSADLVGEFYELLDILQVRTWDLGAPLVGNAYGTLARFASLLADYEKVERRARPDAAAPGEQVGGVDRGEWYYRNFARFISNFALTEYQDFAGEDDPQLDAVSLNTIHSAKGLEWPVVFVPSLTAGRFPTRLTGKAGNWLVPHELFDAARYEGSVDDERRLFYVAITRARDWVAVSRHERVRKQASRPSVFFEELSRMGLEQDPDGVTPPQVQPRERHDDALTISFSEIAAFLECGYSYRLRQRLGFPVRIAPELGYGKAVHHVLRTVAESVRSTGRVPDEARIDGILDESFFLPAANKVGHREMKAAARSLIQTYVAEHRDDLFRIWETERPFELRLPGVTVIGRADVILDREEGEPDSLAIVDYKTSTRGDDGFHDLQLQVYTIAGRREGLDVRAAYVHDLKRSNRVPVPTEADVLRQAEETVVSAADRVKRREFDPNPGDRCRRCDVRAVCGFRS